MARPAGSRNVRWGPVHLLSQFPHTVQEIAKFTPLYGPNQLVHAPLLGGSVPWIWPVNVIVWLATFTGGAIWRFRKDTARV